MMLEKNLNTRIDADRWLRMEKRMKTLQIKEKSEYVRRLIDQDIGPNPKPKRKIK